jgi:hypothetical protein
MYLLIPQMFNKHYSMLGTTQDAGYAMVGKTDFVPAILDVLI